MNKEWICEACGYTKCCCQCDKTSVSAVASNDGLGVCVCGGEVIIEHEGYRYFATCVECDKDGPVCDTWEDACEGWHTMKTQND